MSRGKAEAGRSTSDQPFPSCRGIGDGMQTKGARRNTASPSGDRRRDQPESRERQAGPFGVSGRFIVPKKPGNSGGTTSASAQSAKPTGSSNVMPAEGFVSGCAESTNLSGRRPTVFRIATSTTDLVWFGSPSGQAAFGGRSRDTSSVSRMRETRMSRFDERDVETEHGAANEAPADERAGNGQAVSKPPRHISTLQTTSRLI